MPVDRGPVGAHVACGGLVRAVQPIAIGDASDGPPFLRCDSCGKRTGEPGFYVHVFPSVQEFITRAMMRERGA